MSLSKLKKAMDSFEYALLTNAPDREKYIFEFMGAVADIMGILHPSPPPIPYPYQQVLPIDLDLKQEVKDPSFNQSNLPDLENREISSTLTQEQTQDLNIISKIHI